MGFELPPDDAWVARGYGQAPIEPGERPAVLVVDLQYAFTDPAFPMGGAELVERAVEETAHLLEAARAAGVPVYQAFSAVPRKPRWLTVMRTGSLLRAACATFLPFLGSAEKGRDVHRRYAEVTTADEVIEYLASVSAGVVA